MALHSQNRIGGCVMFKSVELSFSETGSLNLETKGITVFVGPNNSGKSLVLREIEEAFNSYPLPQVFIF
jgi:predicted ATP-dependent endonuclease of OLD family